MFACTLIFISEWPSLMSATSDVPVEARLGGAMLAWLGLMPVALYALAALSHLVARVLGGQGSHYGARLALFWALLAAAPLWLLASALGVAVPGPVALAAEAVALAALIWIWLPGLIVAETGGADAAV